jgi:hypothetical protein
MAKLHDGMLLNLSSLANDSWRNSSGNEVDVVLDWGETCVPVEIKPAKTVASDFFDGLGYWRGLAGDPKHAAALIYGGDQTFRRADVCVYSWAVL